MSLTDKEIAAVEAWREAENARVAAVDRYNEYLKLCEGLVNPDDPMRYAKDERFYKAIGLAEKAVRIAAQNLSVALGCQPDKNES